MPLPEKDEMYLTKRKMIEDIMVSLGGRIAEELVFDDITTGASSDIKKAQTETVYDDEMDGQIDMDAAEAEAEELLHQLEEKSMNL